MSKHELKIAGCSYEAAKHAVTNWHYSRTMPAGRNVYFGVWEYGKYIGAVVFGMGSGNSTNGLRYGLNRTHQIAELVRVALSRYHKTPVSRIVAVSIRLLARQSPNLRLIISMADPRAGHVGGIYQAGNWIYTGKTKPDVMYFSRGEWVHHRTATARGSAKGLPSKHLPAKYRYLMPLDEETRQRILPLSRPYPKRVTNIDSDVLAFHAGQGGASPTVTLQD